MPKFNRSDLRRIKNMSTNELYEFLNTFTEEQEKKAKKEVIDIAVQYTTEAFYSITALALKDLHGFGHKRVAEVLTRMEEKFVNLTTGYASLEDYKTAVKEELNINIKG